MDLLDLPDEVLLRVMGYMSIAEVKAIKLNRHLRLLANAHIWNHGKCIIEVQRNPGKLVSPDHQRYIHKSHYHQLRMEITNCLELIHLWTHTNALLSLLGTTNLSVCVTIHYSLNTFNGVKDCIENVNKMFSNMQTDIRLHLR